MRISLKEIAYPGLKVGDDVLSKVVDPLIMALHECKVLVLVGLECRELIVLPAGLVVFEVLDDMIVEEGLQYV